MIANFYGKDISLSYIKTLFESDQDGVSALALCRGAGLLGLKSYPVTISVGDILGTSDEPFIAHLDQNHFVVVVKSSDETFLVADPAYGMVDVKAEKFLERWTGPESADCGVAIFFTPTDEFYSFTGDHHIGLKRTLRNYLSPFKRQFAWLVVFITLGAVVSVTFPLLIQLLVDEGIHYKDRSLMFYVLLGYLLLFAGNLLMELLKIRMLAKLGLHLTQSLMENFLRNLITLPISFFDKRVTPDVREKINDHGRIREFLMSRKVGAMCSGFHIILLGGVFLYFSSGIFLVFTFLTALNILVARLFQRENRQSVYQHNTKGSGQQTSPLEIASAIRAIKLHNLELYKIGKWEKAQPDDIRNRSARLALAQLHHTGANAVGDLRNILVLFLSAFEVVSGNLTLGSMLAIQYLTAQLSGLVNGFVEAQKTFQALRLDFERLHELDSVKKEDAEMNEASLPEVNKDIIVKNVSFTYPSIVEKALDNVSCSVGHGLITIFIGGSKAGKTTLLKLLLKFYYPSSGYISIGGKDFSQLGEKAWRQRCCVVLQDQEIAFNTIAQNIALRDNVDMERLYMSCRMSNCYDFITSLPLKFETNIGPDGINISPARRQQILLARVFYSGADFVFLDEPTNALDLSDEAFILDNIREFFRGKTVIMTSRRWSPIKFADEIVVMSAGTIIESGTHSELMSNKRDYFELVRSQTLN